MTDKRAQMLLDIIFEDIKFLSARIEKNKNTDAFSGDHVARRYLDGIRQKFTVKCLLEGLCTEDLK